MATQTADTKTPKEIAALAIEVGKARADVLRAMQSLGAALHTLDKAKADYQKLSTKKGKLLQKSEGSGEERVALSIWFDEKVEEVAKGILATPTPPPAGGKAANNLPASAKSIRVGSVLAEVPVPPVNHIDYSERHWQTWPMWDHEKSQASVTRAIPEELMEKYGKTYSADVLFDKGGIRGTFDFDSATYVCTGKAYKGPGGAKSLDAWELVPQGDYERGGGVAGAKNGSSYEGRVVLYHGAQYCMTRPVYFVPQTPEPDPVMDEGLDADHVVEQEALVAFEEDNNQW